MDGVCKNEYFESPRLVLWAGAGSSDSATPVSRLSAPMADTDTQHDASASHAEAHTPTAEEEALSEKHGLVMQIIFKRREVAEKKKKLDDKERCATPPPRCCALISCREKAQAAAAEAARNAAPVSRVQEAQSATANAPALEERQKALADEAARKASTEQSQRLEEERRKVAEARAGASKVNAFKEAELKAKEEREKKLRAMTDKMSARDGSAASGDVRTLIPPHASVP